MTDIDKIASEAEHRHNYKQWRKATGLQLKDFSIVALLLLFAFSPLIVMIIKKVASLLI